MILRTGFIITTSKKQAETSAAQLRARGHEPVVTAKSGGVYTVTWTYTPKNAPA